jgi:hypothetical protein
VLEARISGTCTFALPTRGFLGGNINLDILDVDLILPDQEEQQIERAVAFVNVDRR